MSLVSAYIVPHPPLLVPEVGRGEEKKIPATVTAIETIAADLAARRPDVIILSSPHAPYFADAFFVDTLDVNEGSFLRFGVPGVQIRCLTDTEFVKELRTKAAWEGLYTAGNGNRESIDHGASVPLTYINKKYTGYSLVRIGLSQQDADTHIRFGTLIRRLIDASKKKFAYIASGDLSHYLKADGPYGFRPEGKKFDDLLMDIIRSGKLSDLKTIPADLINGAGQCGYKSFLILLGVLGEGIFQTKVLAYEDYFGVGYGSAIIDPSAAK